jgi:serine/threonine-protein kinase RIO1
MTRLRTFCCFTAKPSLQLWCGRVQNGFYPLLRSAFENGLLNGPPKFTSKFADFFLAEAGDTLLIKRIQVQKEVDYLRRYFGCQAKREFSGSRKLLAHGLNCPEPIGYAFNLVPFSHFDSVFICRFLPETVPAGELVRNIKATAPDVCERVLRAAAADLATMYRKRLFHKDAHLGNVLVHRSGEGTLHWIDNDVAEVSATEQAKLRDLLLSRWLSKSGAAARERKELFEQALRD